MRLFRLLVLIGVLCCVVTADAAPLSTIAYGSCAKQEDPQPIWKALNEADPKLFIFLGDNIYGDSHDMDVMRRKWDMFGAIPEYQKLRNNAEILATWDDHDYGVNDGGAEFEMKAESQQVFLDFFEEPADSPRRKQEGIYDAKVFGPKGKRVQVILLDTRYHRSPLTRKEHGYHKADGHRGKFTVDLSPEATILGAAQWAWLEEQLRVSAEVRIVATSIQLVPNGHHSEKWGNFPLERERFFQLVKLTGAGGVILLSGDRHCAELSRTDDEVGYSLFEVTASPLNRNMGWHNEVNEHRVGVLYTAHNFGMLHIDWDAKDPKITLQICSVNGEVVLQAHTTVGKLQP